MKSILAILLSLFSFANVAFSASAVQSTISHVYPISDTANGDFIIMLSNDQGTACTNAGTPKYYYVFAGQNGATNASVNKMYAAVLVAAASNKQVRIHFDETAPQCWVSSLWVQF